MMLIGVEEGPGSTTFGHREYKAYPFGAACADVRNRTLEITPAADILDDAGAPLRCVGCRGDVRRNDATRGLHESLQQFRPSIRGPLCVRLR